MLLFETILPVLSLVTLNAAYSIYEVGISMAGSSVNNASVSPPLLDNIEFHVANDSFGGLSSKQCSNDDLLKMVYDCQGTEAIYMTPNGSWIYNTDDCWQRKCLIADTFINCAAPILPASTSFGDYEAAAYSLLSNCAWRYPVKSSYSPPPIKSGARPLQVPAVMTVVAVAVAALC